MKYISNLSLLKELSLFSCAPINHDGLSILAKLNQLEKLEITKSHEITSIANLIPLSQIKSLNLEESHYLNDEGLSSIEDFTLLTHLNLSCSDITDQSLKQIQKLSQLKTLDLSFTHISNEGLSYLSSLTELTELNLICDNITNDGISFLKPLKNLKKLCLSKRSKINAEGLNHLAEIKTLKVEIL